MAYPVIVNNCMYIHSNNMATLSSLVITELLDMRTINNFNTRINIKKL